MSGRLPLNGRQGSEGRAGAVPRPTHAPARRLALAIAALAALGATALITSLGVLDALERPSIATRFSLRHIAPPSDIVLVEIDDQTFQDLARQWPFPRSLHARVIRRLHGAHARAIVYDVQFTEPTQAAQDLALYRAIGAAGGVTLATSESDQQGHTNVLGGDANLARVDARAAAANLPTTAGGVLMRYPYAVSGLESIAVAVAERATGRAISTSGFETGGAWIDYRGGAGTFASVPFSAVLRGRVPARFFRGKIVIVGATAPSFQDLHSTPLSNRSLMSGAEVEANAIWTAMHGNPLRSGADWITDLTILIAALTAPVAALRFGVLPSAAATLAAAAGYAAVAQGAFERGTVLSVASPLLAFTLGTAGMLGASYFTASADRRQLGWAVTRRTEQLRDSQLEIITRLAQAADSRDSTTGQHTERISLLCERLALELGLDAASARMLRWASAMHDVGKIGIPDRVLLKPGPLDENEWEIMKSHTTKGSEILSGSHFPLIQMAETIARTHHERWDGSGYPSRLKELQIPLVSRICAICDVFDALLSERPYKRAWPLAPALDEIARGSGTHFDPTVVRAFLAIAPGLVSDLVPSQLGGVLPESALPSPDVSTDARTNAALR